MSELGAIFYRGPSLLTGDPIVGILTGLEGGSLNPKTGAMAQAWVIRPDRAPMDAVRTGADDAICGDCALRGRGGRDRKCYVVPWLAPMNVYRNLTTGGGYLEASWPELQAIVEGRHLRICAYGDPAAVPFDVWRMLLVTAAGHTAYTHQWQSCDQRLKTFAMASVDSESEFWDAREHGWRTFRVRDPEDGLIISGFGSPLEVVCPASDEGHHRTTCDRCALCRGQRVPARSIAIFPHGHNGVMTAFHRSRAAAEALS
jgi:hypothetical protein